METTDDALATVGRLLRSATESTAPADVLTAAWNELHRPIALVDTRGRALAAVPSGSEGKRAVSAATCRLRSVEPGRTAWVFQSVRYDRRPLGMLSMSAEPKPSMSEIRFLDVVSSLCGDQLHRVELERMLVAQRQAHLRRRIVTHPGLSRNAILAEARAAGLSLTGYYWPSLVWWRQGVLTPPTLRRLQQAAAASGQRRSLLVLLDAQVLVLLFADHAAGSERRAAVHHWVVGVVAAARSLAGLGGVHVLAADGSLAPHDVASSVEALLQLRRCQPRSWAGDRVPEARSLALERLLGESLDQARARAFVMQRAGRLLAHDRACGTDLAMTLEIALDHPARDAAARAAHVHRNTFRRKVRRALELVDCDAEDPDERLALHVALRLARLLGLGPPVV